MMTLEKFEEAIAEKEQLLESIAKESQDLEKAKDDIAQELESVKAEYAEYKEQVETEKAEAAKDVLATERVETLKQSGVNVSEANIEKWFGRLREMDEETFADFKDLLVESVASVKDDKEEEDTDEEVVISTVGSLKGLNLEQKKEPGKVEKYEKLWEKVLSDEGFFGE